MDHSPDRQKGVFTSIAIRNERPVLLDRHLTRLQQSCRAIYGQSLPGNMHEDVRTAAVGRSESDRIRVEAVPLDNGLDVRIDVGPRPGGAEPMEVDTAKVRDWQGGDKWLDRSMLPSSRTLFIDDRELVLELDIANVFAVIDGEIATPPLD